MIIFVLFVALNDVSNYYYLLNYTTVYRVNFERLQSLDADRKALYEINLKDYSRMLRVRATNPRIALREGRLYWFI